MLEHELAPPLDGSALAAWERRLEAGEASTVGDREQDCLLYVFGGFGTITLDGRESELERGAAALVLAGEHGELEAGSSGLAALLTTVAPIADRHAPMGGREVTTRLDDAGAERATGARSFQILFGPHSGSTRATLFAGFIPPGKAPWHYHLYDEIVWVPEGPGRLHLEEGTEELGPGSAFRLRPRQVHIVENLSTDREMTVIGVFTPAGSPSAAYLTPDVAAEYRFSG
ncbi:MAG TPA: cupin domain-containing protein [Gaiellaceae bacterium]|nr:cupin domain-containing protein [Gaiellaceae bacterium]